MDPAFEDLYPDLKDALAGTKHIRRNQLRGLGSSLYRSIFPGKIGSKFDHLIDGLGENEGIRILLNFEQAHTEYPGYPWEYLYDPRKGEYLACYPNVSLSRWIALDQPYQPLQVAFPLRMLLILSHPPGGDVWLKIFDQALQSLQERIDREVLIDPSFETLQNVVANNAFHLIHYLGHGEFDQDSGSLIFTSDDGESEPIHEEDVAAAFLASQTVRMVCLTACESGQQVVLPDV